MAGKRKAEGIALLSLYNDEETEDDDEEEEEEEEDQQQEEREKGNGAEEQAEGEQEQEHEESKAEQGEGNVDTAEIDESLKISVSAVSETQDLPETVRSPADIVAGNGSGGNIVDYAHDEVADEEGETLSAGRAVFGLAIDISNGFFQEATISTTQDDPIDDKIEGSKLTANPDQTTITTTSEIVDIEMSAIEERDNNTTSKLDPLADFLPPPPVEKCSNELQQKFAKYLMLKNAGRSFNEELRKSKGYRNPDFLQRAVKYQEIDQIGSCFKKEIFDPHGYDPSDFYDALALEFKREQERKEQAKKQSQRVDFVHGGVQMAQISTLTGTATVNATAQIVAPPSEAVVKSDSGRIKKSKWDKVDSDSKVLAPLPPVSKSALGAHNALLTSNAGSGYASYIQQKRKEVEERSRSSEKKSDRR